MATLVTIQITPTVNSEELSQEELELPLEVEVSVNDNITQAQLADAALDVFHDNIAVDCLDNFEFTVLQNGKPLETDPNHESYSLSGEGHIA